MPECLLRVRDCWEYVVVTLQLRAVAKRFFCPPSVDLLVETQATNRTTLTKATSLSSLAILLYPRAQPPTSTRLRRFDTKFTWLYACDRHTEIAFIRESICFQTTGGYNLLVHSYDFFPLAYGGDRSWSDSTNC